ncbi:hypothetical protein ScalyP_jg9544 [Parmales sp. scaly parma]|nr:hypothetical protein ScalyP_jg9544 [Parmales sp. scaly parma]
MDHEKGLVIDDILGGIQARLSLEGTVLEQRAAELKTEAYKLARQRAFLREERRKAREDALANQQDNEEFQNMKRKDWFPEEYLKGYRNEYRKVKINVGGQLFELSEILLRREPNSLLSALLEQDSPLSDENSGGVDGAVHVDRDWWLFRHILKFLRDGILPRDRDLLTHMYKEASFWRFTNLKLAIEEERLNLRRKSMKWEDDELVVENEQEENDKWYKSLPNWWESQDGGKKKNNKKKKYKTYDPSDVGADGEGGRDNGDDDDDDDEKDWWTGNKYKGKKFVLKGGGGDSDDDDDNNNNNNNNNNNKSKPSKFNSTWSSSGSGGGGRHSHSHSHSHSGYAGDSRGKGYNLSSRSYGDYGDFSY